MEIIACFFVLVYPTCSAGQAKTVANLEVFIAVNDVLLMERDSTVHWMVNNYCNHAIANGTVRAVHGLQKRGIMDKIIVSANFFPILTRIGLSEGFLTAFLKDDISEVPL